MSDLRKKLDEVVAFGPDVDEITPSAPVEGLPVTWRDGTTGESVGKVTSAEVHHYAERTDAYSTCGECKFFDLKNGQREMARQRFTERLVNDEKWKLHHLGTPLEWVGLCGASGGQLATTFVTRACDQFRPRRGKVIKIGPSR